MHAMNECMNEWTFPKTAGGHEHFVKMIKNAAAVKNAGGERVHNTPHGFPSGVY